jgi:hypothetical protein
MNKIISAAIATIFAASVAVPAIAADQKKEQAHKGTPEAGTVHKAEKAQKKDGSAKAAQPKAAESGKAAQPTKAVEPAKAAEPAKAGK